MLIHADWKRYENFGLVGAFDEDDAKHAISLAAAGVTTLPTVETPIGKL